MFEDSLLEGSHTIHERRTTSTFVSLGLQSALLAGIVALPLFTSQGLPAHRWLTAPVPIAAPPADPPPEREPTRNPAAATTIIPNDGVIRMPRRIPRTIDTSPEPDRPRGVYPFGVPGGDPNGRPDGVLNSILTASAGPPPPLPPPTAPRRLLISRYDPGMLIHQVTPVYPHTALITRTEGAVVLRAIVGKDGTVKDLRVVSGNPFLTAAALDAVRQWQFKPYILNGAPIEIETQVTVNFVLNR